MNIGEANLALTQIGAAVAELNRRVTSLTDVFAATNKLVETLDVTTESILPRIEAKDAADAEVKAQRQLGDDGRRVMTEARNLMNLVGKDSSAAIAYHHEVYTRRLADIDESVGKGILTHLEGSKATDELTRLYRDQKAEIEGRMSAGALGGALARFTSAPIAAVGSGIASQAGGIAQGLMGLVQGLPIAGGLFGLMMYGYQEADRLRAEAGEMANIVSSARGTASRGATAGFAAFQEQAQKFMGISRQEVQANLRAFVDAGLTIDDVLAVHDKGLGQVGHDAVTMSLALDKHFEWGAGQAAGLAMTLVKERGNSLEQSITSLTKLSFAAQRAGVATLEFASTAVHGAADLSQFGVDAESVGAVLLTAIDRYKEIGANPQLAFKTAQQGLTEFSEGLKRSPIGVKAVLAEEMGIGSGMEGAQGLEDALHHGDKRELMSFITAANRMAKKMTKGTAGGSDEVRERSWLETNFGPEGSRLIQELGNKSDGGKIKDLDQQEWGKLKDAFKTEAQKVSDIQKSKEAVLKGMAMMGEAMLKLLANFSAMAIIAMKALTSLDYTLEGGAWVAGKMFGDGAADAVRGLGAIAGGDKSGRVAAIRGKFNEYWGGAQQAMVEFSQGAQTSGDAAMKIMGPILDPVAKALRFSGADMGEVEIPMDDEGRINQALYGDAGIGDDGVRQTKHRAGASKLVNVALSQVGSLAKGSEPNKFSRGRAEWWCMDFVGWAYEQVGYAPWGAFTDSMWGTYQFKGYKGMEAWGRKNGYWRDPQGYVPRPGDIFFLERWSGATPGEGAFVGEHVGMVVDVMEDGTLLTVEGNAVQNGLNGVWQHRRDPSRSIFRGFVTTEIAGKATASMAARQKYLDKTRKNWERRKKNIATQKTRKEVEIARQNTEVQKRVLAKAEQTGVAYSSAELTSSQEHPEVKASATLKSTAAGPQVEVTVDLSGVDFSKVQLGGGDSRAGVADAQRRLNAP